MVEGNPPAKGVTNVTPLAGGAGLSPGVPQAGGLLGLVEALGL